MNCLGRAEYDPAVAVSASTGSAIAMTALDTTNLRLSFTVPASGNVQVRLQANLTPSIGAVPSILLGVLEGATVVFRAAPLGGLKTTAAANVMVTQEASGVITGLTPTAAKTWDAAYGVETIISASNLLKYGGPDDTTVSNAWGAILFEIYEA